MVTEEERWALASEKAGKLLGSLKSAHENLLATETPLKEICEIHGKPWACTVGEHLAAQIPTSRLEGDIEHVDRDTIPKINENRPVGVGMTASEKSYAHSRVTYIKSHLDKLEGVAVGAPKVLDETAAVRTNLETLSAQITVDPRARHSSPLGSRRGLTVHARRRLRG